MKRNLALVLILVLVLSLAFPAAALAKKGGIPANGKSNGRAADVAEAAGDEAPSEDADVVVETDKGKGKDQQKDKDNGNGKKGAEAGEAEGSDETSPTPEVKRTGVENALARLQRNLERMQAQLESGERTGLPEGIQRAIAKFMSWLGIDPPSDEAENTDEGSDETSGTVEPEPVDDADDEAAGTDTTEAPVNE